MSNTKDTPMVKSTESERTDLIIRSLKLELQKQKELKDELVKELESVLRLRKLFEFAPDEFIGEEHEGEAVAINRMIFLLESLIKKSNEI